MNANFEYDGVKTDPNANKYQRVTRRCFDVVGPRGCALNLISARENE